MNKIIQTCFRAALIGVFAAVFAIDAQGITLAQPGIPVPDVIPMARAAEPPVPYGPFPSERQLQWHEMEFYGFIHFTVNTFTGKEWGYGDESPSIFNPTAFDADQIVSAAKAGGLKGLIITAKHHDGFCLWPSKFTEHSIKNSPWKNGKGDMVREFSDACRKHGLKFGVYLSPWDRNRADYGKPEYLAYFRNQLRELLTQYGPVFEVWFDGANGGDGYYGGARERRKIDQKNYYEWATTFKLIRELQPDACIWGNAGPDIRWIGNERGRTAGACWATLDLDKHPEDLVVGHLNYLRLTVGDRPGKSWAPAESDISIRPGWFYHANEDSAVKNPAVLSEIYYRTVGRGGAMLLNLPPDRRGRIHDNDVQALKGLRALLDATFKRNLAVGSRAAASNIRGGDARFGAENVLDGKRETYWSTDDAVLTPELVLSFEQPVAFNVISLREYLPLGQRIEEYAVDAWVNGAWKQICQGCAVGAHQLQRTADTTTEKVRLRILKSPVCPAISEFGLYLEPAEGRAVSPEANADAERVEQGLPKKGWKASCPGGATALEEAARAIDGDPKTLWTGKLSSDSQTTPTQIIVDMGSTQTVAGFLYLPRQDGKTEGNVDQYAFYLSMDGQDWRSPVASGEFGNIVASPIQQRVRLEHPIKARHFKFVPLHATSGDQLSVAELGVFSK